MYNDERPALGIKAMDKAQILNEIRRLASANGGKAPGVSVFERETGLRRTDWFPHLWLRWSDALVGAGYEANRRQPAYPKEFLVERFIAFIRELGHVPVKGEFLLKAKADKTFPSQTAFYQEGKEALLRHVLQYYHAHPGHEDVMALMHSIETDEPVGVEAYWHKRLAEKRGEGEWFDLSTEDIAAFKRWRRIV